MPKAKGVSHSASDDMDSSGDQQRTKSELRQLRDYAIERNRELKELMTLFQAAHVSSETSQRSILAALEDLQSSMAALERRLPPMPQPQAATMASQSDSRCGPVNAPPCSSLWLARPVDPRASTPSSTVAHVEGTPTARATGTHLHSRVNCVDSEWIDGLAGLGVADSMDIGLSSSGGAGGRNCGVDKHMGDCGYVDRVAITNLHRQQEYTMGHNVANGVYWVTFRKTGICIVCGMNGVNCGMFSRTGIGVVCDAIRFDGDGFSRTGIGDCWDYEVGSSGKELALVSEFDFPRDNFYSPEIIRATKLRDSAENGRAMVRFSLSSPELVVCAGSPDIPRTSCVESPEILESRCHQNLDTLMELSFENGICASQSKDTNRTPTVKFSTTLCETYKEDSSPAASFELLRLKVIEEKSNEDHVLDVNGNVGCEDGFLGGEFPKGDGNAMCEGDYQKLLICYENQRKELEEMRSAFVELKRQNQHKSNECQEAWNSLKDLQNELMRKSMHVGSLAFAIEGQVKEKSKWFASLSDLTRKIKIMKMDHIKLSEEASAYKKCLEDMEEMRSIIHSTLNQQASFHNDLKTKFIEGAKERKELYNKVLELKGNIRVFCRCRPLNSEEVAVGASMAIDFESEKEGELAVKSNGLTRRTFKFDALFSPQADQADVFEDTAAFATSVLDGFNVCIFAYGQTGSGKTFTMEGTEQARGVNFRTLEKLFHIINERENVHRYDVSVSVLEVYNEQIRDLLVPGNQPGTTAKRLEIRQAAEGTHHVLGLVEAQVKNMSAVWEVLQTGSNARVVGSTNCNEHSSRSHCLHCVMVKGENLLTGESTRSKLWLVDLAGSERIGKAEVQGDRLKETQNINRSLSALGDVISALATKSSHIPFRNSKLTHLLQDSLGGDSKTLMFLQISPNENDLSETLCSLNFASRVRGIELGPAKRQMDTYEAFRYKQMFEKTKLDIKSKDVQIRKMEETVSGLELKIRERDLKNKCLQDKVKELESQLLVERKLARQHVDTKIAEQHLKHQDDQTTAMTRPPLMSQPLTTHKILIETAINTLRMDLVNPTEQLTEKASNKIPVPTMDGFVKWIDPIEKENNPDMAEQFVPQKRTGRASVCPTFQRIPATTAPRRNSLIPLPTIPNRIPMPASTLPPIPAYHTDDKPDMDSVTESEYLPEQIPCSSPKVTKTGGQKLNSLLRRSIRKKGQMKSPMPPHMRKGLNVGMEKLRVSIGSRGRLLPHRVLHGTGRRAGTTREGQKQIKEKERGWNIGTAGRNAI